MNRIIIEYIINQSVMDVEDIAIADVTTRRGVLMWLKRGRSNIISSSLVVWKKS